MVFPHIQRLKYTGNKVKDYHTVGFYNIQKEHTLHLMGRLRGGGKRKLGGTAGATQEQRVRVLKESIGTSMVRINAMPGVSPVVTERMERFNQLSQVVYSNPTHVFSEILNATPGADFIQLIDATTNSNKIKTRIKHITNVLLKMCIDRIEELRSQLERTENTITEIFELMLVSQYGDAAGNINWADLSKEIATTMATKAQQSATAHYSSGIGP